jgi:hypothetical protein
MKGSQVRSSAKSSEVIIPEDDEPSVLAKQDSGHHLAKPSSPSSRHSGLSQ